MLVPLNHLITFNQIYDPCTGEPRCVWSDEFKVRASPATPALQVLERTVGEALFFTFEEAGFQEKFLAERLEFVWMVKHFNRGHMP